MPTKSYTIYDPSTGLPLDKESLRGPKGDKGDSADITLMQYRHVQAVAQTVWTIPHDLGIDPAGIMVTDSDGNILDGWGVQYLTPGVSLRISFDIPSAGTARLS